jgi:hypothetical protein
MEIVGSGFVSRLPVPLVGDCTLAWRGLPRIVDLDIRWRHQRTTTRSHRDVRSWACRATIDERALDGFLTERRTRKPHVHWRGRSSPISSLLNVTRNSRQTAVVRSQGVVGVGRFRITRYRLRPRPTGARNWASSRWRSFSKRSARTVAKVPYLASVVMGILAHRPPSVTPRCSGPGCRTRQRRSRCDDGTRRGQCTRPTRRR